ncbi:MAG: hypothetical protein KDK04_06150 [Candidatus Competibacteraceae bacterium]|nr:hypothetical protein [Candidatus Competibacteraceae bacterium]
MENQARNRKQDVRTRAATPDPYNAYCRVPGCSRPARAGTADGLDRRYCRSHYDHFQSHGSLFKGSYKAKELNPYRQAALRWILDHEDDLWVKHTLQKMSVLYSRAGAHVEAFRLRGMSPRERAWAHWARLRKHIVDPRLPVAAWLAIEMILRDDQQPDLRKEYKRVQAAKIVHRMASGSHRKWTTHYTRNNDPTRTMEYAQELHVYPRPRGRVLRHIGKDLEEACELIVEYHLASIHISKKARDKNGRYDSSPYPDRRSARKRNS